MQNVPKIVRQRLQAAGRADPRPEAHPDADLLTAFAERSLPEFERTSVLDHLARCGDCREVVALALPASEETSGPVVVRSVRTSTRGWLSWPALRWGLVAAGVAAVASVGVLRYQRHQATMVTPSARVEVATNEPKKQDLDRFVAPAPTEKEKLQSPAAPASADSLKTRGSADDAKKIASPIEASPAGEFSSQAGGAISGGRRGSNFGGQSTFGPRVANQLLQQNTVQNTAQNSAPVAPPPSAYPSQAAGQVAANKSAPSASETVEATNAAPVTATEAQNLDALRGRDLPTDLPSIDRAKPLVPSVATPPSASGAATATINQPYQGRSFGGPIAAPGKMVGYVVDPSGAVVPNVRITVTPSNSRGAATAVTDSQGAWLIAGLPTGSYKARAEAPGFRTAVLNLNYDANRPSLYRFNLDVGNTAEMVEVTGENSLVQTEGASVVGPINGRNFAQLIALVPRWTISASGGLQRSLDQGKTWQAVDVNANPAYFANSADATSLQIIAETSRAKKSEDKDSKVQKQEAPTLTFRAVAAAGSDVWAGGAGGALYHSMDAGSHWTRIVPGSAGTTLTGDIIGLDFPDPQHGKLSTSTSEVWTTADSGQTWQKQ